jgi:ketosteroid isomerase-like protein
MKRTLALIVGALVLPATVSYAQIVARVDEGIRPASTELVAVRAAFIDALNSRDAARLGSLYAPDAIVVLSDGRILHGAREIGAHFERTSSSPAVGTLTLTPGRFDSTGDIRSETGTTMETSRHEGAPSSAASGAYVVIYSRQPGGEWRITMELRTTGRQAGLVGW